MTAPNEQSAQTPLVDAVAWRDDLGPQYVSADFARDLERRVIRLQESLLAEQELNERLLFQRNCADGEVAALRADKYNITHDFAVMRIRAEKAEQQLAEAQRELAYRNTQYDDLWAAIHADNKSRNDELAALREQLAERTKEAARWEADHTHVAGLFQMQRAALEEVCRVLQSNTTAIIDTVWVSTGMPETLLDHCLAALDQANRAGKEPS